MNYKENTRPHWEGCVEATDGTCLYRQESEEERVPLLPDDACMGAAANRQVALMATNPTDHECSCKYEVALMATNPYRPLLEQCLYHPGGACMDACRRRGIKFAYMLSTHPVKEGCLIVSNFIWIVEFLSNVPPKRSIRGHLERPPRRRGLISLMSTHMHGTTVACKRLSAYVKMKLVSFFFSYRSLVSYVNVMLCYCLFYAPN